MLIDTWVTSAQNDVIKGAGQLGKNDTTWGKCYITLFAGNLRIFVISKGICPWQAFSA